MINIEITIKDGSGEPVWLIHENDGVRLFAPETARWSLTKAQHNFLSTLNGVEWPEGIEWDLQKTRA